jgi:peptide/nickel transport system permease protein
LRLASIPAFTIAGVLVGTLLAGSVVVETVFSRAGVGRLTQTSVMAQDIPVVQGDVVFASQVYVHVNLAVDHFNPLIDPRIIQAKKTVAERSNAEKSNPESSTDLEPTHV